MIYPTMSMIRNGLAATLGKAIFYFHWDSLVEKLGSRFAAALTHDVYDPTRVSSKRGKTRPLFSIEYGEVQGGNLQLSGLEPTMSMMHKDLGENWVPRRFRILLRIRDEAL